MKVTVSLVLSLSLMGCYLSDPSVSETPQANHACAIHVAFQSDDARAVFLDHNKNALIAGARTQNRFVIWSNPGLVLITSGSCTDNSDEQLSGLGDAGLVTTRDDLHVGQARRLLEEARRLSLEDSDTERQCVLRFSKRNEDTFARLVLFFPYTGLRRVQIEGADGDVFVAVDENCELASSFLMEALQQSEFVDSVGLYECRDSSLRECGYPAHIEY